jgi:phosphatidylglycerophosphatase A
MICAREWKHSSILLRWREKAACVMWKYLWKQLITGSKNMEVRIWNNSYGRLWICDDCFIIRGLRGIKLLLLHGYHCFESDDTSGIHSYHLRTGKVMDDGWIWWDETVYIPMFFSFPSPPSYASGVCCTVACNHVIFVVISSVKIVVYFLLGKF